MIRVRIAAILFTLVLLSVSISAQNIEAYFSINIKDAKVKFDEKFLGELNDEVRESLKEKNITLQDNEKLESANKGYLYITVVVNDKVVIETDYKGNNDSYTSTAKYKKNIYEYKCKEELKKYVTKYIQENL